VGVGDVNHEEFVKLAEKSFSQLPTTAGQTSITPAFTRSEIRIRDAVLHDVHAAFTFEAVGIDHPHFWTLLLVRELIGSYSKYAGGGTSLSSRLAENVSKQNLGKSFQCFYDVYKHSGLFGVYSESDASQIEDFTFHIFDEFQKMNGFILREELIRAKNMAIQSALRRQTEGYTAVANTIGHQILGLGRRIPVPEFIERINSVESSDIKNVLDTYFYDVDPAVVAYGPITDLPDYNVMRGWTYWNRW